MTYPTRIRTGRLFLACAGILLAPAAAALSISDTPLYLTVQVQPNVLIDLSIETPMQGAAYNDHTDSVPGCTGRPTNDPGSTVTLSNHTHVGLTSNGSPPTYSIADFEDADGSQNGSDPGSNLVSVTVNGVSQTYDGTFTGTCTTSNDPSQNNHYLTQISGTTLSFCFRSSSTMRNKAIVVVHKQASVSAGSGGTTYAWGTCYLKTQRYLGYFDPNKCYDYSGSQFTPLASPTYAIGASATCGGHWSGNYLNWATMTAIDEFRAALTGGNRSTDTTTATVLQRANQTLSHGHAWFPVKVIGTSVAPGNVSPGTVSPSGASSLYVYNHGYQFDIGSAYNTSDVASNYYAQVKVCDSTAGLESNCKSFSGTNKPTGLIQDNADRMRFAVTSYLKDDSQSRDGGVLRAKMKPTGLQMLSSGAWTDNPNKEWDSHGVFVTNPDSTDATASGVSKSGVINYINQFGANGYKSYDPVGELFYEALRYYKHLGPTPEYSSGLTTAMKDGFPVITSWDDPVQLSCQKNFIVAINDANPWLDKRLPGTYFTCGRAGQTGLPSSFLAGDCGEPSNPDGAINVRELTNAVGSYEGLNGVTWSNSGTWTSGTVSGVNDSVGYVPGVSSGAGSCTNKTVTNLGEIMGTCPSPSKENSYYIAGLAYYANTSDLRDDFDGKQSVSTFMIDTQEYSSNPLDGNKNMLWLAGKYGGFIDKNGNNRPDLPGEWDADNDGVPDNYVLASQPEKLVNALNRAFTDILDRVSSASAVATNSTRLSTNTRVFQARFNSGDWTGQLRAYPLNSDGSIGSLIWDASTLVPSYGSRTIITRNTATGNAVSADWANLSASQQTYLNTNISGVVDGLGSARLAWLLGSSAQEARNGGSFRNRSSTVLGDVINSDPSYVGVQNFAYDFLDASESTSYPSFRSANASRTPMVYVGANDGMLHAFNASTGAEAFAYVPGALYPNLSKLTAPNYAHRYYADGSPYVGEGYLSGAWHSVLVSGLNAGGKSVYALDVTNPSSFGTSNVLWEVSNADADFANLGYTYGQPQIAKLQNGDWVAVFGNGYGGANNHAVLYIVDLATGSLRKAFDTGVGDAAHENGMSTPALLDTDGDFKMDTVFVGDLQGNVWRIDLSGNSPSNWDFAYTTGGAPAPLFSARNSAGQAQPITAPLEIGVPPSGQSGYMIYFGTGTYFQTTDSANLQIQSFYGILDDGTAVSTTDRSDLVAQTITSEVVHDPDGVSNNGDETQYRTTSSNSVNYASKRGWYMDLIVDGGSAQGERVVSAPLLLNGMVIFPTLIPGSDPCLYGGDSWLMQVLATTGGAPGRSVFDVNGDALFDTNDQIDGEYVSGKKSKVGIIKTPAVVKTGGATFLVASGTSGDIETTKTLGESRRPHSSWKQIQ